MSKHLLFILILAVCTNVFAQQTKSISGVVYDSNTGEALIGVSVLEVGTTNGTITDFDGKYTLKVSSNKVSFSYVGFKTEIVNVTNSGTYNVNLVSDNELDEVVVIGYGTQRKSDLTGALASISSKDIKNYAVSNASELLTGKAAGVFVAASSGQPGSDAVIRVSPQWQARNYFNGTEVIRSAASEANYCKEWKEIIDCLYSYPSIAVWVPFNEAWGQFKTPEIVAWTKEYDPSRLVNPASGGNHYTCGDILDLHHYPGPNMFLYDPRRATVLGEYGGIGLVVEGNTWVNDKKNWGYVKFNTSDEVTNEYIKYGKHLLELIQKGFSAAVYTQTTDVEGEINGLMTYDRKVIKMNEAKVREINQQICNSLNK